MSANEWVLLWSHSRNEVIAKPLAEALSDGRIAYRDNQAYDWTPMHIGNRETITAAVGFCQQTLMSRAPQAKAWGWAMGVADPAAIEVL